MASQGGKYNTSAPSCNRLLEQRYHEKTFMEHRDRLKKTKSTVDAGKPKEYNHLRQKAKKHQMDYERWTQIDRHNHELLARMEKIMMSRGRVDHLNDYKAKPCLHHITRQLEAERVHRDNLSLLKKLQTMKPIYRTDVWESDFKQHQGLQQSISRFPPVKSKTWQGKTAVTRSRRPVEGGKAAGEEEEEEEEIQVVDDGAADTSGHERVTLPPVVEEKPRNPSQLAQSLKVTKERQRSKSPEEIVEIMN